MPKNVKKTPKTENKKNQKNKQKTDDFNKEVSSVIIVRPIRVFDDWADVCEFWACAYFGIMQRLDSMTLRRTQSALSKYLAVYMCQY